METKLNNLLFLLLMLISCNSLSQQVSLTQINIEDISINNLGKLGENPEENIIISNFGVPKRRVVVPQQPEWDDGGLQLFYENDTQFYYSKQGDEYFLENITIASKYFDLIVRNDTISIGDSLERLRTFFKGSYEYFKKNNTKIHSNTKKKFYISLIHNMEGGNYYTSNISITISDDLIDSIYINLVEGN